MKKVTLLLSMIALIGFGLKANAQEEVSKELLLTTLNSVASLKLDNDKVNKLMEYNTGFVDQVSEILDSDKDEKRKKESLEALSQTRESDLHDFLTKHETNKYLKLMEDELKPLTRKNKLLKHIAKI